MAFSLPENCYLMDRGDSKRNGSFPRIWAAWLKSKTCLCTLIIEINVELKVLITNAKLICSTFTIGSKRNQRKLLPSSETLLIIKILKIKFCTLFSVMSSSSRYNWRSSLVFSPGLRNPVGEVWTRRDHRLFFRKHMMSQKYHLEYKAVTIFWWDSRFTLRVQAIKHVITAHPQSDCPGLWLPCPGNTVY